LAQVIKETRSLDSYFKNLSPTQRAILDDPVKYQGAASKRTKQICDDWEKQLSAMSG
jgi:SMC interacting uncharacterized protein involved in chromosome segregation